MNQGTQPTNFLQLMEIKAALFDSTVAAIGMALTSTQQFAVSERLTQDQAAFLQWLGTDEGRKAARVMAEAFTYRAPEPAKVEPAPKPEVKP